jgi:general secretion pathway protein A
MDLKMFGLERNPFKNAPGSTSFYSSVNHKKLLDSLLLGLRERYGLHLILGENGTGKTTLCRFIQLAYAHEFDLGYLGNPFVTDHEFLRHVLTEFGVPHEPTATNKELMDAFGRHLAQQFAKGRTVALFIDEAHHLDRSIFDQLLVMANMQQGGVPMVQIVLCGLPELLGVLAKPGMGSLNQRIGTRTMLAPLSLEETAKYIRYRLEAAKSRDLSLFAPKAVKIIWKATGGKPRLINHLSRLSLERAAGEGRHAISPAVVKAALKDSAYTSLFDPEAYQAPVPRTPGRRGQTLLKGLSAATLVALAAWGLATYGQEFVSRFVPTREPPVQADAPPTPGAIPGPVLPAPLPALVPTPDTQSVEVMKSAAEAVKSAAESLKTMAESVRSAGSQPAMAPRAEDESMLLPPPVLPTAEPGNIKGTYVVPDLPPGTPASPPLEEAPVAAQRPAKEQPTPAAPVLPAAKIVPPGQFEPLPPRLANLHVNAIAWHNDAAKRMVVMDDRILHQGDSLMGTTVETIGQDHVILTEHNHRYLLQLSGTP